MVDNHPKHKREWLLYGLEQKSVFFDTGADNTNEKFKNSGNKVCHNLHGPETKPDDLDPDPELLLVCTANRASDGASLRENNGNGQQKRNRRNVNHVPRDNAPVQDLVVDPAHAVESCLLFMFAWR